MRAGCDYFYSYSYSNQLNSAIYLWTLHNTFDGTVMNNANCNVVSFSMVNTIKRIE